MAIVGRPNVGKSTLVNRIIRRRAAVVAEVAGVTRDARDFEAEWAGRQFVVVDTGGWMTEPEDELEEAVRGRAEAAARTADVVVMVVDATAGVSQDDAGVVALLRKSKIPVVLAANKVDGIAQEPAAAELWKLGLGTPYPVSGLHGRGSGDLLDAIVGAFPDPEAPVDEIEDIPRICIVGRPNVGKSTLLNRLIGDFRVLVSERPGTTRDPIDVEVEVQGERYVVVDTAGMRRAPRIKEQADYWSVLRARETLKQSDLAVLVIDGVDGVTNQDQDIAAATVEAGAGLVVMMNKWDAATTEQKAISRTELGDKLGFVSWAPVVAGSARTGSKIDRLGPAISTALSHRSQRITTGELNRQVQSWISAHPPPTRKGRRPRIQYIVQAAVGPPTFVLFVSGGDIAPDYLRYLEARLRDTYDFTGTPVVFRTRR